MGVENGMKKRTVKKYVNRYIYSQTKVLKSIDTFCQEEVKVVDGVEVVAVYANNHTIRNGEEKLAGEMSNKSQDLLKNIRLTGLKAKQIINSHKHVYFRLFEIRGNQVRMRIIME